LSRRRRARKTATFSTVSSPKYPPIYFSPERLFGGLRFGVSIMVVSETAAGGYKKSFWFAAEAPVEFQA
jgi:hypothetical protein